MLESTTFDAWKCSRLNPNGKCEIKEIRADGAAWCGRTHWQGRTAMRISVSCWATEQSAVEKSLDAMLRIAAE